MLRFPAIPRKGNQKNFSGPIGIAADIHATIGQNGNPYKKRPIPSRILLKVFACFYPKEFA
jgi:hypothetical protein